LSKSKKPLIVVIDDDRPLGQSIIGLLESLGYVAVGFASAEEFLKSPDLHRTACLILDVRMPAMGGLELQRRLLSENNRTPIIFMTAEGGLDISAEALRRGAVAFLRKPFDQDSLLGALRSALSDNDAA
jgi:FixJ family two-component response regulator